jgi:hypothetical protein
VRLIKNVVSGDDLGKLSWDGTPLLKSSKSCSHHYELPPRGFSTLQTLSQKANAVFEIRLQSPNLDSASHMQHPGLKDITPMAASVSINVYGPMHSADAVGKFLQKCEVFLQTPDRCEFCVPYNNPHCLPSKQENTVMTSVSNGKTVDDPRQDEKDDAGLFDEFGNEEQFEEEEQVPLVKTTLHRLAYPQLLSQYKTNDLT